MKRANLTQQQTTNTAHHHNTTAPRHTHFTHSRQSPAYHRGLRIQPFLYYLSACFPSRRLRGAAGRRCSGPAVSQVSAWSAPTGDTARGD